MSRITSVEWSGRAASVAAVLLFALAAACGPSEEERAALARGEAWAELVQAHADLNARRAELEQLRAQATSPGEGEDAEALAASVEEMKEEIGAEGEAFSQKLVNHINEAKWDVGGEMTAEQQAAFAMMSSEDMVVAQEYVVEGGAYGRAIDILKRAQEMDPNNPELAARIAEYQEARYVTAERFAQVRRGMSTAEVEAILGKVHHLFERSYPEQGAFAWFYAKDPAEYGEDAAGGVFFYENDDKVYRADFDAAKGKKKEEAE